METITIRSMLALLVLCGACSLLPPIQANEFKYCITSTEYPVSVHDLEISPQPVVNGKYTTFTMTIIPEVDPITSGKWKIEISNSSGIAISESYNICSETPCPVNVNQLATLSKTKIYEWLQPGTYTLIMRIISGDCDDWVCVKSDFELVDSTSSYIRKVSGMYV